MLGKRNFFFLYALSDTTSLLKHFLRHIISKVLGPSLVQSLCIQAPSSTHTQQMSIPT